METQLEIQILLQEVLGNVGDVIESLHAGGINSAGAIHFAFFKETKTPEPK